MTAAETVSSPPDWSLQATEILCPLCEYNLRGLTGNQCPECGFTFDWRELLEAEKNRHPYLYEYGKGLNVSRFFRTCWSAWRPRRFWRELSPAQPVVMKRLLGYYVLTQLICFGILLAAVGQPAKVLWRANLANRAWWTQVPGEPNQFAYSRASYWSVSGRAPRLSRDELNEAYPLPWHLSYWGRLWSTALKDGQYGFPRQNLVISCACVGIVWPWLTLAGLTIFRISMGRAKIRVSHLIRAVIYSGNVGLLMALMLGASLVYGRCGFSDGWLVLAVTAVAFLITCYRLTVAFGRYLRVHLPFATVMVSQIISFLIVFLALVPIADFSRGI